MDSSFKGAAKRLSGQDLGKIGASIGVGENELRAFMSVESAGSGFDKQGRPKMLFEPHIFYKNLTGNQRKEAVKQGLAYPKWGEKKYPADSYPRLKAAMKINVDAAIKSASWGLFQNLGSYYKDVGYSTPLDMVEAFADSEAAQVHAAVKLMTKWGIADDLKVHRWANVAKVWNGSGYKKNKYDTKLAAAYERLAKNNKPVALASVAPIDPKSTPAPEPASDKEMIQRVQAGLTLLKYNPGGTDGIMGPLTKGAILAFRNDHDLPPSDSIDEELIKAIGTATPREMVPARANADSTVIAAKVPEINKHWWNKYVAIGLGAPTAIGGAVEQLAPATGYLQPVKDFLGDIPTSVWVIAIVLVAGVVWWNSRQGQIAGDEAYRTGDRR